MRHTLKKRKKCALLFCKGTFFQRKYWKIYYLIHPQENNDSKRILPLFGVPKKVCNHAVVRNQIKRKQRALFYQHQEQIKKLTSLLPADHQLLIAFIYNTPKKHCYKQLLPYFHKAIQTVIQRMVTLSSHKKKKINFIERSID